MERDPKVVLMGEDIGKLGGVFRVTEGLQKDFGEDRVIDTPLAEAGIMGTAVGLALRGYKPVVEIQFDGFVYNAFDHIVSSIAKMRARSLGHVEMPIVVRIPFGGGIGAVEHHSESNEAYFAHTAGLRVVCLLQPARRALDDPAGHRLSRPGDLLRAQAALLGQGRDRRRAGRGLFQAATLRQGTDVTVLAYGPMVRTCLQAAQAAAEEGAALRSSTCARSRRWTRGPSSSRCAAPGVVSWSTRPRRSSASVPRSPRSSSRSVSTHCRRRLPASAATTCPYPPSRIEEEFLPDLDRVLDAVDRLMAY
jgi:2-oxoisovalerate dehydrogenase E1 component beta subunit